MSSCVPANTNFPFGPTLRATVLPEDSVRMLASVTVRSPSSYTVVWQTIGEVRVHSSHPSSLTVHIFLPVFTE
jgi:hypothetical protein